MRRKDGTLVGHTEIATVEEALGRPWWVVHRAHLHEGLAKVGQQLGAEIFINSAVTRLHYQESQEVTVETKRGAKYTFDLLIGADGINSVTRRHLFPDVTPEPPTTNCAYRAIVPYDQIRKDPVAKEIVEKLTMEVWMAENAYIITYPINAGTMFNLVLSHHRPQKLRATEHDVPIHELHNEYKDFDPRIKRIVDMIDNTVSPAYGLELRGGFLLTIPVAVASDGDWPAEVVVISAEECRAHGRLSTLNGKPYGSGGGHFDRRRCFPRKVHRQGRRGQAATRRGCADLRGRADAQGLCQAAGVIPQRRHLAPARRPGAESTG